MRKMIEQYKNIVKNMLIEIVQKETGLYLSGSDLEVELDKEFGFITFTYETYDINKSEFVKGKGFVSTVGKIELNGKWISDME